MRRTRLPIAAILTVGVLSLSAQPALGQAVVQQVAVDVVIDGVAPHRVVRDRLGATVASVAERLLVGRTVDQLTSLQAQLSEAIRDVVTRVVTGYTVRGIAVQLGTTTLLAVQFQAVGPVIVTTTVAVDLRAVHPKVQPLMDSLLVPGAVADTQAALIGLPLAALPWAGALIEAEIRGRVETALAGYTADVRIRPAEAAQVALAVTPRDSRVIRNIGVRFRSNSIPTVLLDQHTPQVISLAEPLRGLPVAFGEAHRPWLSQLLTAELAAYPPARQYNVVATVGLEVAETTYLNVVADSLLYRARVEAHLNVGAQAPPAAIVARVGRLAAPGVEPFLQLRLIPSTLTIGWEVGLRIEVSPSAAVGATYDLSLQQGSAWAGAQLSRDIGVRGTWNATTQALEGILTYRINDFLAGEFVGTSGGAVWLRLVSNL